MGASAFAHKAGLHASAIRVDPDLYQHTDPANVGNDMRMLVSDMAGRASIELKGRELGFDLVGPPELLGRVTDRVKDAEARATPTRPRTRPSSCCCSRSWTGSAPAFFTVESWRAFVERRGPRGTPATAEATVKLHGGRRTHRQHR